jgi:hypothetical protein
MTLLPPTPPFVCIATSIFRRYRLHRCLPPPPPVSSRFFTSRNLGLASADPLRISPELQLAIFQKGNKGCKPVIGRLIAPCTAAFIFHHCCHRHHWPFLVAVAVGMAVGVSLAVAVAVE